MVILRADGWQHAPVATDHSGFVGLHGSSRGIDGGSGGSSGNALDHFGTFENSEGDEDSECDSEAEHLSMLRARREVDRMFGVELLGLPLLQGKPSGKFHFFWMGDYRIHWAGGISRLWAGPE